MLTLRCIAGLERRRPLTLVQCEIDDSLLGHQSLQSVAFRAFRWTRMMSDVDSDGGCRRVLSTAVRPVPEFGHPSESLRAVAVLREGPHLCL